LSYWAQAGAQALYHWDFSSNAQFGETDSSANPTLSYWVDYYLSHWLPSPPGQDILQTNSSGCCLWIDHTGAMYGLDTHTLALRNPDGSVVILMSSHGVQKIYKDNNGTGVSRTFALDLSALGKFSSAILVTLDAATPTTGPQIQSVTPSHTNPGDYSRLWCGVVAACQCQTQPHRRRRAKWRNFPVWSDSAW
jgi:hypothetical protein